jgi:DNA-binding MarR family transcriptional regulator
MAAARTSPTTSTTSPVSSDVGDLAVRLRLAATRLARQLRQQSSAGLSPSQQSALASIDRHGPRTLGEHADHERVAPPTITKVVNKLEADGLVARQADPDDRRFCRVTTTVAGDDFLTETRERRDAWLAVRLDALDADERRRLADALDVLESLTTGEP